MCSVPWSRTSCCFWTQSPGSSLQDVVETFALRGSFMAELRDDRQHSFFKGLDVADPASVQALESNQEFLMEMCATLAPDVCMVPVTILLVWNHITQKTDISKHPARICEYWVWATCEEEDAQRRVESVGITSRGAGAGKIAGNLVLEPQNRWSDAISIIAFVRSDCYCIYIYIIYIFYYKPISTLFI